MSSQYKEDQGTEATMNAPGITGIVEGTENIVVENMQIGGTNILQKDIIERANNIVIENIQIGETNILKKGDNQNQRLVDKAESEMHFWKERRIVFTETSVFRKCKEQLKIGNHLNLMGISGEGKTSIAMELLYQSERIPIIIREPGQWEDVDVKEGNLIALIDDMFGELSLENDRKKAWLKKLPSMYAVVREGKVQIITTSREHIFMSCNKELTQYDLFKGNNVHLSRTDSDYHLKSEDKLQILKKYIQVSDLKILVSETVKTYSLSHNDRQINEQELESIAGMETTLGFPQCCKVFVSDFKCFRKGLEFFRRPFEVIEQVLDVMYQSEEENVKYDYCTLGCVLIYGGLTEECMENIDDEKSDICFNVTNIARACRIKSVSTADIRHAAERLSTSYLTCQDEMYSFKHSSMLQAVFSSFFKSRTELLIRLCDWKLLKDLISIEGTKEKSDMLCTLPPRHYDKFFSRLTAEMTEHDQGYLRLSSVLSHRVFDDTDFVNKFFENLTEAHKSRLFTTRYWGSYSILEVSACCSKACLFARLVSELQGVWSQDKLKKELKETLVGVCWVGNYSVYTYITTQLCLPPDGDCLRAAALHGRSEIVSDMLLHNEHIFREALCNACRKGMFDDYKCVLGYIDRHKIAGSINDEVLMAAASGAQWSRGRDIMADLESRGYKVPDYEDK